MENNKCNIYVRKDDINMMIKKNYAMCLLLVFILAGCSSNKISTMIGIYYTGEDGNSNYIIESDEVMVLNNHTEDEAIYKDIQNGDKIEITYEYILESYPSQIPFYSLKLIEEGDESDLPKDTVEKFEARQEEARANFDAEEHKVLEHIVVDN